LSPITYLSGSGSVPTNMRAFMNWVLTPISLVKNIFKPGALLSGDLNGDGVIGMADFSVLAYWYHRPGAPSRADQNGDGKIDLTDFSILAHHWSGGKSKL
jgi:hypothetical protein